MQAIILLLVLTNLIILTNCDCESLKNVKVTAISVKGENFDITVNSCIEPQIFSGRAVKMLYAKHQIVRQLNSNSIKDMDQLEAVSFDECSIKEVEAGAFKNVPRLMEIFLVKSYIRAIPKGVFNDMKSLYKIRLHNNSIQTIEKQAFSNLPGLKKLYVSHNKLEYWDADWFTNSRALEKIDFESNMIQKIPQYAFKDLPNLIKINFNYNNISLIENSAFEGIRNLKYLGLRYNLLSVINADIFTNPIRINTLFIDANRLNYISSETQLMLTVNNITLDGNPWNCPCLTIVGSWLRSTNGNVKTSKYCKGGDGYQCVPLHYNCTEAVDEEVTTQYMNVARYRVQKKKLNSNCVRLN